MTDFRIKILEKFWPRNKAKGLLAQVVFSQEAEKGGFGKEAKEKIHQGCWLFAPKSPDFFRFRFSFFVHPEVVKKGADLDPKALLGDHFRPFHAITEFMNNAGTGLVYVIPITKTGGFDTAQMEKGDFSSIEWQFLGLQNGKFVQENPQDFFDKWPGNRGRASHGGEWDTDTKTGISALDTKILTELLLTELFYAGLTKGIMKKPVCDPYDVDAFLISLSQKHIFPMEIKEKFPGISGKDKFFGIDAGRIMMLLRLCLPNDANAIYLIREVDEKDHFIGWKYITLGDIVMTSSWNLQAGGPGMGGQSTQTVRLPYEYFREFNEDLVSEDSLAKIGNLPRDIKTLAKQFCEELASKFYR